jgi:hypothetical protein
MQSLSPARNWMSRPLRQRGLKDTRTAATHYAIEHHLI